MSLTAILYLLVYFYCLFKALTTRAIFGLYAYFLAFYLHPPARWWGKDLPDLRWSFLAAFIALLAVFIHSKKDKKIFFEFKENRIFFLFVIYVIVQLIWALNSHIHQEYVFLAIKFLVLIFVLQNAIKTEKELLGIILVNLFGICFYSYVGMTELSGGRLEGIGTPGMESANQLGQHMATVLVFSAYLLLCDFGKKKFLLIPLIIIALNGVLLTQSRGVLVGLLVTGFFALWVIPRLARKQFLIYAGLATLAGIVLVGPQIVERFESMLGTGESGEQDKSAGSRMVIINAQMEMFLEKPIFGYGHRGTLLLSQQFIPEEYLTSAGGGGERRASHNFLFSLLVDHGLIGTTLYLMVIFSCFKKVRYIHKTSKHHKDSPHLVIIMVGLGLALLCLMVGGMGSNNKKLEIDIWLYALIPLVYSWIVNQRQRELNLINKDD